VAFEQGHLCRVLSPNHDAAILARGREPSVIKHEESVNRTLMSAQNGNSGACRRIPSDHAFIETSRHDGLAVDGNGDGPNRAAMAAQFLRLRSARKRKRRGKPQARKRQNAAPGLPQWASLIRADARAGRRVGDFRRFLNAFKEKCGPRSEYRGGDDGQQECTHGFISLADLRPACECRFVTTGDI
jgi:hypothetical protein